MGAAVQYDSISILGHRISAGATITVYGADDSAFTSNVVSDVIPWNAVNIRAYLAAARTKRYIKLEVVDASNADGYGQLGTIVVAKFTDLGVQFLRGYGDGPDDYTQIERSPSHNLFVTQDAPSFERFSLEFSNLDETAKAGVKDLLKNNGLHLAYEICFDYTAPNTNTYWVLNLEVNQPTNTAFHKWHWTTVVEEHA
jgi:hypothetical protein